MLLKRLCMKEIGWDDPIGLKENFAWEEFLRPVSIKCSQLLFLNDLMQKREFQLFSHASELGYSAVVFGQWNGKDSNGLVGVLPLRIGLKLPSPHDPTPEAK